MYFGILAIFFILQIHDLADARGKISCRSCLASEYSSRTRRCYDNPNNVTSHMCPHHRFYCQTKIILKDGFPEIIQRGCVDPEMDYDQSTTGTPHYSQCISNFDERSHKETTTCYYPCHTNNCNNITTHAVRTCEGDCLAQYGNGHCNYVTGNCVCNKGWTGSNCEQTLTVQAQKSYRKCVQCNEQMDRECSTKTLATPCPSDSSQYNHCATTRTNMFSPDGKIVRSYISRSCIRANSFGNQCYFSTPEDPNYIDHTEHTCVSICDVDGCNTGMPESPSNFPRKQNLFCLVCEGTNDDGECARGDVTRTLCTSQANYCKSTVTYLLSEKNNFRYKADPEYKFGKITRECAKYIVRRPTCFSEDVATLNVKSVTCEETCTDDGCNTGWPARPSCSQCSSTYNADGYDSCLGDPDWPKQCPKPYEEYCVTLDYQANLAKALSSPKKDGFRRKVHRGCSYHDVGSKCLEMEYFGVNVTNCNKTCSETGCNLGVLNGSKTLKSTWISPLIFLVLSFYYFVSEP